MGLTYAEFEELPEQERIDRLAFEYYREEVINAILEWKNKDGKLMVDIAAYSTLKVALL